MRAERERAAIGSLVTDADEGAIAVVTAAELLLGVELSDPRQRPQRRAYVDAVLAVIPIEDYDLEVARAHARLLAYTRHSGRPRGAHDLIVAATASARAGIVVTADTSGFDGLPGVDVRSYS